MTQVLYLNEENSNKMNKSRDFLNIFHKYILNHFRMGWLSFIKAKVFLIAILFLMFWEVCLYSPKRLHIQISKRFYMITSSFKVFVGKIHDIQHRRNIFWNNKSQIGSLRCNKYYSWNINYNNKITTLNKTKE